VRIRAVASRSYGGRKGSGLHSGEEETMEPALAGHEAVDHDGVAAGVWGSASG